MKPDAARNEEAAPYFVVPKHEQTKLETVSVEDAAIANALQILNKRLYKHGLVMTCPEDAKKYLVFKLAQLEHEEFHVLWLDVANRVIALERLFVGTLTTCSVYAREVVKAALRHNACHAVLVHNHPSGAPTASEPDLHLTQALKVALAMVGVQVLDHMIVGGTDVFSFAEHGIL